MDILKVTVHICSRFIKGGSHNYNFLGGPQNLNKQRSALLDNKHISIYRCVGIHLFLYLPYRDSDKCLNVVGMSVSELCFWDC